MSKKAVLPEAAKEFDLEEKIVRAQGLLIAVAVLAHGCESFTEFAINNAATSAANIGREILEDILDHYSEDKVR